MKIDIKLEGLAELQAGLKDFSDRRFNAAVATALTRTAAQAQADARAALQSSIDRPTPYTMRALKYTRATAANLQAWVGFDVEVVQDIRGQVTGYARSSDTPASRYMAPQVDGGGRSLKRFERALQAKRAMPAGWQAVPGAGARLDAFGNMSRGQIAQIIAQLGTELLSGYTNTPKSTRSRITGQRKAGGQFIAVLPGQKTKLKPGIYQREFTGRNLTPVLMFVKTTSYRPRFDFVGVTSRSINTHLQTEIERAVADQLANLAKRG